MCGAITSTLRTLLYRAQGQIYFSSELRRWKVPLTQDVFLVRSGISKQRDNESTHAPNLIDYFSYVPNNL